MTWKPGDPIYREPARNSPILEAMLARLEGDRPRTEMSRPMVWQAAGARPGPWSWLQPDACGVREAA